MSYLTYSEIKLIDQDAGGLSFNPEYYLWEPRFKSGFHISFWDLVVPHRISWMTLEIYKWNLGTSFDSFFCGNTSVQTYLQCVVLKQPSPLKNHPYWAVSIIPCWPLSVVRDFTHDGSWNTFDESVLKLLKVSFQGITRTLQSNINIKSPPQSAAPHL